MSSTLLLDATAAVATMVLGMGGGTHVRHVDFSAICAPADLVDERTEEEWQAMIDAVMPSPEQLRELVRRSPPPPEWFERDEPCPF